MKIKYAVAAGALALVLGNAQAELFDRGGGLIYDSDLNITWLADANYANTSGYQSPTWYTPGGWMQWNQALTWASNLTYGGYSDWRLPTTLIPDPSCSGQGVGISYGYGCSGSELGHLFYIELGATAGNSILNSTNPDFSLFKNIKEFGYWSETINPQYSGNAEYFNTQDGGQLANTIGMNYYAWAVRDGDVASVAAPVPEPETYAMLMAGLGILGAIARRRKHKAT